MMSRVGLETGEMVDMDAFHFFLSPVQEDEGVMMYLEKNQIADCEKAAPIFLPVSCGHCHGRQEQKQSWRWQKLKQSKVSLFPHRGKKCDLK